MNSDTEFSFYVTPGPMTELRSCPNGSLQGLPNDPVGLMKVVRGCVIDKQILSDRHNIEAPVRDDGAIRKASQMIDRIRSLDPSPIVNAREPQNRFLGTCRHFATLSCALLRWTGIPARVRAGFASYFVEDTWVDHWIIEYRDGGRWVRVDPELDDEVLVRQAPHLSSQSLADSGFLSGTEAWQRCRRGELDPDRFVMGGTNRGIGEIRGSVLYDLAALNQDEMLPWDEWGEMGAGYSGQAGPGYDELLDVVSDVVASGDLSRVREVYETNSHLKVPDSISGR